MSNVLGLTVIMLILMAIILFFLGVAVSVILSNFSINLEPLLSIDRLGPPVAAIFITIGVTLICAVIIVAVFRVLMKVGNLEFMNEEPKKKSPTTVGKIQKTSAKLAAVNFLIGLILLIIGV